jgi:hypothetical protein
VSEQEEKTNENGSENQKKTGFLPSFTIRNAKKTDVDAFKNLTDGCENASEGFGLLVNLAKTAKENIGKPTVDLSLLDQFRSENLTDHNEILKFVIQDYLSLASHLSAMTEEIKKLNEALEEKPKEVQVPQPLTGTQFICELDPKTAVAARKARSFIKKDGKLKTENYPSDLANISIIYFLKNEYSHVI